MRIVDCWSSISLLKIVPELLPLGVVDGSIFEKLVLIFVLEPEAVVTIGEMETLARENWVVCELLDRTYLYLLIISSLMRWWDLGERIHGTSSCCCDCLNGTIP